MNDPASNRSAAGPQDNSPQVSSPETASQEPYDINSKHDYASQYASVGYQSPFVPSGDQWEAQRPFLTLEPEPRSEQLSASALLSGKGKPLQLRTSGYTSGDTQPFSGPSGRGTYTLGPKSDMSDAGEPTTMEPLSTETKLDVDHMDPPRILSASSSGTVGPIQSPTVPARQGLAYGRPIRSESLHQARSLADVVGELPLAFDLPATKAPADKSTTANVSAGKRAFTTIKKTCTSCARRKIRCFKTERRSQCDPCKASDLSCVYEPRKEYNKPTGEI